jgi:hypothetical protein
VIEKSTAIWMNSLEKPLEDDKFIPLTHFEEENHQRE